MVNIPYVYQRRRIKTSDVTYAFGGEMYKLQERWCSPFMDGEEKWVTIAENIDPEDSKKWVLASPKECKKEE